MADKKLTAKEIRDRLGCIVDVNDVISIQGAQLLWLNFAGEKRNQFDSEGDRNFNLWLTPEQNEQLTKEGWNTKCKAPRDDDEDQVERCTLKIKVGWDVKPPKIWMIGSRTRNRTLLDERTSVNLDAAEIVECDLSFVPYFWHIQATDSIGVSAYLRSAYVVVREDELDEKWAEEVTSDV